VHLPQTGTHGDLAFLRIDVSNNNLDTHNDLDLQLAADFKGGSLDSDGARKIAFSDLTAADASDPADLEVTLTGGTLSGMCTDRNSLRSTAIPP